MGDVLPSIATARVYAPGMTCVYEQLFQGASASRWMAYRFKNDFDGAADRMSLEGDPADVLAQVIAGNIRDTAHVFADTPAVRAALGDRVEYDILAVESRWLMYDQSLLSFTDWARFEDAVAPMFDKAVYYFDVDFAHAGTLFDVALVRPIGPHEVARWEQRSVLKHRLLSVLSKFRSCTYVDVSAMAANVGYINACIDQIDHYTPTFRTLIGGIFAQDANGATHRANGSVISRLMRRTEGKSVEMEVLGGMEQSTPAGGDLLVLRLTIVADDPLVCPTQLVVTWKSHVRAIVDWSEFRVENDLLRYKVDWRADWLLDYVHKLLNIKTAGCFDVQVVE